MKYKLINPVIEGGFDTIYSAKSPIKAAHKCWLKLSSLLSNSVPSFAFTMKEMDGGSNVMHHYKVHEKKNAKDKKVSFEISELSLTLTEGQMKRLENLENETKSKKGGLGAHVDSEENEEDNGDDSIDQVGGGCSKYGYWDNSSAYYCNKYKSYAITPLMPVKTWSYWPIFYTWDIAYYIPQFIAPLAPYIAIYPY